jgi:ribose transport system permease protein
MKRIIGLALINIAFIVLLAMTTPYFMSKGNLITLIDNMAIEAIVLSGYTLLLIGGHFDLSTDGVVALSGISAGLLMNSGVSWYIAVGVAMLVAAFIGLVNGIVVIKANINGLIATLTTWWICIGVGLGMTKGLSPHSFPDIFQTIGQTRVLGFRITVIYAVIAIIVISVILHLTRTGAHIYTSGDNSQSSALMGIEVDRLGIGAYLLVALLAGFVGVVLSSRMNASSIGVVDGMTLRIIAAAVIGGCSLSGGKGSVIGGILGLLLMSILGNAIIQWGISPYWQKAVLGGILLTAALSERLNFVRRRKRNA